MGWRGEGVGVGVGEGLNAGVETFNTCDGVDEVMHVLVDVCHLCRVSGDAAQR